MKAYILFAGERYYPGGGMEDYCGTFTSIEMAVCEFESLGLHDPWGHVVDTDTIMKVYDWNVDFDYWCEPEEADEVHELWVRRTNRKRRLKDIRTYERMINNRSWDDWDRKRRPPIDRNSPVFTESVKVSTPIEVKYEDYT